MLTTYNKLVTFGDFWHKALGSKILWFFSLLEGNLPFSKDKNQSILLPQTLKTLSNATNMPFQSQ